MRLSTITAVLATFLTSTIACGTSDLKGPNGSPTSAPVSGETIQMGSKFTITWTPTSSDPINILLLAGPTAQSLKTIDTIASNVTNSGSFVWTVPASSSGLKSTTKSGYGIQIVDTGSCTFQTSSDFGISDPSISTTSTITLKFASSSKTEVVVTTVVTAAVTGATGTAKVTSPVLSPSKSMTVPSSLKPTIVGLSSAVSVKASSTSSGLAVPTGQVDWNVGVMMVAGLVGAMAL